MTEHNTTSATDNDLQTECIAAVINNNQPKEYNRVLINFIKVLNEIADYGYKKHGNNSFQQQMILGTRDYSDRVNPEAFREHSDGHFYEVVIKCKHDHFGTLKHQLGAVAFNAMMAYYMLDLENE